MNTKKNHDVIADGDEIAGRRAQTTLIGTLLILSLIVTAAAIVLVVGGGAIDEVKTQGETESAEHAMANLDAQASLAALGTNKRSVVVSLETSSHGVLKTTNEGNINVTLTNQNTGNTTVLLDQQLGTVIYENKRSGEVIAYQGGGVWRGTGNASQMISPPEFHYRGETLTVPLIVVDDENSSPSGNRLLVKRNGERPVFPNSTANSTNPLQGQRVEITITSDYYVAWGFFFEQRTGGEVTYNHAEDQVKITLVTPLDTVTAESAFATTTPSELRIIATGSTDQFTDSYNSSEGPYPNSSTTRGDVATQGGLFLQGNANLYGNVTADTYVDLRSGATVNGNVAYGTTFNTSGSPNVTGWVANNGSVDDISNIDSTVVGRVETVESNNDNDPAPAIDDNSWTSQDVTLEAGEYYINDSGNIDELTFNTSDGDITLAVDDDIDWDNAKVDVTDPSAGRVRLYVNGTTMNLKSVVMGDNSTHDSTSLQVFGKSDLDIVMKSGHFTGLIYAPAEVSGGGTAADIKSGQQVYGAIVIGGGETIVQSGATIHYDRALAAEPIRPQETSIPRVTYIHMTVNRIVVEGQ